MKLECEVIREMPRLMVILMKVMEDIMERTTAFEKYTFFT